MSYLGAGKKFMDVVTYSGNGSTQSIGGLDFSPDFVWIKSRSGALSHNLYDTIRGPQMALVSNTNGAEADYSPNYLSSFDSNGFTLGGGGTNANSSSQTYVAWCWKAGDTTVTNTDGTITSQVRANPAAGFSVVSYTAPPTDTFTIGHGLGEEPSMMIVKATNKAYSWDVYLSTLGPTQRIQLDTTSASATNSGVWANTSPTSSVFTQSSNGNYYVDGDELIAYCWSEVPGYSKFGTYTGNGSADGPFVYTGFKPRWIMIKATSATGPWVIIDTERGSDKLLYADVSSAEDTNATAISGVTSSGFRLSSKSDVNGNNDTFIYAAFAELPIADPSPKTELTLASTKDWDNLVVGNTLTQPSTGLSGVIESKDLANSKITLSSGVDMETGSPTTSPVDGSGTVVSVDVSTNSMVLENVTGGFAANRGKFLEGSIRRLPKYQSETSVLTDVEDVADYQIANSLRFDGETSYLSRTPGADGNLTTWTFSAWFKRGELVNGQFLNAGTDNENRVFVRLLNDSIAFAQKSSSVWNLDIRSDETFTDPSAWCHLVAVYDSNNATETDRARVYVNGERLNFTAYSPTWPTQGLESEIDLPTAIGTTAYSVSTSPYNGYLSDVQFVDGQALDCFAFGEFNPFGQWIAKDYARNTTLDTIISTSGDTQLTLASNTNLSDLSVDAIIKQDSGYTPQTSAITNVTGGGDVTGDTWSNYVYTSPTSTFETNPTQQSNWYDGTPADLFDGDTSDYSHSADVGGGWLYWIPPVTLLVNKIRIHSQYLERIRFNGETTDYVTSPTTPNSTAQWYEVTAPPGLVTSIAWQGMSGFTGRASAIEINGSVVTDGNVIVDADPTVLTLTDDTDLANLRVGDIVNNGNTTVYDGLSVFTTTSGNANLTLSNGGRTVTKAASPSGASQAAGFAPKGGKAYFEVQVTTSGGGALEFGWGPTSSTDAYWLCAHNQFYVPNVGNIALSSPAANSASYTVMCAIDVYKKKIWYGIDGNWHNGENPAAGINSYWTADFEPGQLVTRMTQSAGGSGSGTIPTNPAYLPDGFIYNSAKVYNVGSNTLSVDIEEVWSNGDTATGPATEAGVGTVTAFDSTANTINYTLKSGRFIEGEGKYVTYQQGEYGTNGFHLSFDSSAQGVNYTGGILSSLVNPTNTYGTFTGGGFNGVAGDIVPGALNLFGSQTTGTQSGKLVVPINKAYTQSIKMYGYQNTNGTITLRIDGADYNSGLGTSTNGLNLPLTTISGIPASGTLESITVTQSNFTGATGFTGVYLDDILLVNHNNIGVDDSSNGNNWSDQNFAVGNTSEIWSDYLSSTYDTIQRETFMFDGRTTQSSDDGMRVDFNSTSDGLQTFTWQLPADYPESVTSFEVWTYNDPAASAIVRTMNIGGSDYVIPNQQSVRYNWESVPVASNGVFRTFTYTATGGAGGIIIGGIKINGTLIVNPNAVDTTTDSPTDYGTETGLGGESRGNYCTLNPMTLDLGDLSSGTLSNGNLLWTGTGNNDNVTGTLAASSGKFYYEVTPITNANKLVAGWTTIEATTHTNVTALFFYESAGIRSGTKTSVWDNDVTTGLSISENDVIGFAIDIDNGSLQIYQNGSLISTITLPTDKGDLWIPCLADSSTSDAVANVNFGQLPFVHTAPTGFLTLNTKNLP